MSRPHRPGDRVLYRRAHTYTRRHHRAIAAGLLVGALLLAPMRSTAHAADLVAPSLDAWAAAYGIPAASMEALAWCESGGDPNAYNAVSGAHGVLQFLPGSFAQGEAMLNADPTLAPNLSTFDPEYRGIDSYDAQAHVAAWLIYRGYAAWWSCAGRAGL